MVYLDEAKFQTLFGQSFSNKNARFMKFIEKTPPKQIFKKSVIPPVISMTVGGTLGGLIGSVGGPKGAAVGIGSGVGIGFMTGGVYAGYQTRKAYKQWIRQYRCDEVLADCLDLSIDCPEIKEFICPISKKLIHYPFKDPGGFNYERSAIELWVKRYHTSPKMKTKITLSDLKPNYALMGRQAKFYRDLLRDKFAHVQLTPIQRAGIEAVLDDLRHQIKHCFEAENKHLYTMLVNDQISMKTYWSKLGLIIDMLEISD